MIRRFLRRAADRVLVGPRPAVKVPLEAGPRWTEQVVATTPPPPETPTAQILLEVEDAVPGSLLLDIREPGEMAGGVAQGAMLLPMDMVPHHLDRLPRDRPITIYCAAGVRSFGVAHWLREQGFPGAVSLVGGLSTLLHDGHPVEVPAGPPGAPVVLPAGEQDGVYHPAAQGEVICIEGGTLRARVRDDHGFWVERVVAVLPPVVGANSAKGAG